MLGRLLATKISNIFSWKSVMNQNVLAEHNRKDTRIWKYKKPIKNFPVVFKILTPVECFHSDEGFNSKCPICVI
jgi:hypothetical protein